MSFKLFSAANSVTNTIPIVSSDQLQKNREVTQVEHAKMDNNSITNTNLPIHIGYYSKMNNKHQENDNHINIPDNNDKFNELDLESPFSSCTSLLSHNITTNKTFIYFSDDTVTEYDNPYGHDSDYSDSESIHSIPLILKMTPPPLLLPNEIESDYDEHQCYTDDEITVPSEFKISFPSLSSPKLSTIYSNQCTYPILEAYDTITPSPQYYNGDDDNNNNIDIDIDDETNEDYMDDYYDQRGIAKSKYIINNKSQKTKKDLDKEHAPKQAKSFNFTNIQPANCMNEHVRSHILCLIEGNESD